MFKAGQLIRSIFATEIGDEDHYGTFLVLEAVPGADQRYSDTEGNERYASSLFNYYELLSPNGLKCYLREDCELDWKVVSQ